MEVVKVAIDMVMVVGGWWSSVKLDESDYCWRWFSVGWFASVCWFKTRDDARKILIQSVIAHLSAQDRI